MFSFPSENLQKVGFVFGGREIRLQSQDFGLGGTKTQGGKMCSALSSGLSGNPRKTYGSLAAFSWIMS